MSPSGCDLRSPISFPTTINVMISRVGWVLTNGPGERSSILSWVIPKTQNMILGTSLLNSQNYIVRFKSKLEQSRKRSSALPFTLVISFLLRCGTRYNIWGAQLCSKSPLKVYLSSLLTITPPEAPLHLGVIAIDYGDRHYYLLYIYIYICQDWVKDSVTKKFLWWHHTSSMGSKHCNTDEKCLNWKCYNAKSLPSSSHLPWEYHL